MKPTVREIQQTTARSFGVPMSEMKEWQRPGANYGVLTPRHVAMYLAREITGKSYPLIAERFWRKDHTTVIYGHRRAKQFIQKYPSLAAKVREIREELAA